MSLNHDVRRTMEHLTGQGAPKSIGTLGTRPVALSRDRKRHHLYIVGYSKGQESVQASKRQDNYLTFSLEANGVVDFDPMKDRVDGMFLLEKEGDLYYLRLLDSVEPGLVIDTDYRARVNP